MKQNYKVSCNVTASTSEATYVSEGLVKEGIGICQLTAIQCFLLPKDGQQPEKKSVPVDEFLESVVRIEIHKLYTVEQVVPNIRKLNTALKTSDNINCSNEYLHKFIHNRF